MFDTLREDLKQSGRMLVKNPGFLGVVVLTLGLGIGVNATMFSVVNGFLRPLAVDNPEELVVVARQTRGDEPETNVPYLDFKDFKTATDAFSDMTAYNLGFAGLSVSGRANRILFTGVEPNYFAMLGIRPAAGRFIGAEDGTVEAAEAVLVLGHTLWKTRLGADPGIVGTKVLINGRPFTVIGIVPESFVGLYSIVEPHAYIPLAQTPLIEPVYKSVLTERGSSGMRVVARLKPGVSVEQATAAVQVVARRLEMEHPETNKDQDARVFPERLARPEPAASAVLPTIIALFMGLVTLVLAVACANVVNLILSRAASRQKELAMRAALGAGRGRLVRQLLTESLVLSALGGIAGIIVAYWGNRVLQLVPISGDLPFRFDFSLDWRVVTYTSVVALVTGIVVGILPALRLSGADVQAILRDSRGTTASGSRQRMQGALVVAQVAVTLLLLVSAGLFVRSLDAAHRADFGFNRSNVLNVSLDPSLIGYDTERSQAFYRELELRLKEMPGVHAVGFARDVPMGYSRRNSGVEALDKPRENGARLPVAGMNNVSPGYADALDLRIVSGRGFTADDTASSPRVALIDESLAERVWPGEDIIGKRFRYSGKDGPVVEVVGLTKDAQYNGLAQGERTGYFLIPLAQAFDPGQTVHVRTTGDPTALAPQVRQAIASIDADVPIFDVITMEQHVYSSGNGLALPRVAALLASIVGGLGLVLAIVGVYGVVSYSVSQRTNEIGIRVALGANRASVLGMVLRRGLTLVIAGVAVGLVGGYGAGKVLANFLIGISPSDPLTFAAMVATLIAIAVIACYVPARRATRIDPMIALRRE